MVCSTTDNLNIYYEIQGNEAAKETLVFLNGLSQSTASWFLTTPYFKENHKIILIDLIFKDKVIKLEIGEPLINTQVM